MDGEQIIIVILVFLLLVQAIIIHFSSESERLLKLECEKQENSIQKLEDQNEELKKEIKFLEKNINISKQLDRMNNLLELEMKYNQEYKRLFE